MTDNYSGAGRNLSILFFCQLIATTGTTTLVTLAGIVGSALTPNPAWATVPVSASILGTASATIPAAFAMKRWGRRAGFSVSAGLAATGSLIAAYAIVSRFFELFVLACFVIGSHLAFVLQYRFAAAESVPPGRVGRAVSWVLVGSIGGAFLAPEIVTRGKYLLEGSLYAGTLVLLAAIYSVASLLLLGLRDLAPVLDETQAGEPRPLGEILRQPACALAIFAGMVAYGVMTLVMTATPLSMHLLDGFDIELTGAVIRGHVIAMYLPSLVTGLLIERVGVGRMMTFGAVVFLVTVAVAVSGRQLGHYRWALILLGVGWNLLFIGGTTLLTRTYRAAERYKVQAVNEFSMFGTSALASLVAGGLIHASGWAPVALTPLPLVTLVLAGLVWRFRDPLLR